MKNKGNIQAPVIYPKPHMVEAYMDGKFVGIVAVHAPESYRDMQRKLETA
jgi:hypothetical protein